jgi:internalin A
MNYLKIFFFLIGLTSYSAVFSQNKKLSKSEKNIENANSKTTDKKQEVLSKVEEITQTGSTSVTSNNLTAFDIDAALKNAKTTTKLVLKNRKLTSIPSEISQLTNLEELDLSGNELIECSSGLQSLKNLKTLNLSGNKLKSIPSEICELKNLETLNLSNNEIKGGSLGCLTNLKWLYLNNNKLSDFPEGLFQLKSLKTLMIQGNQLTIIPDKINDLKNLQIFSIYANKIPSEPYFISLENLHKIYFYPQSLPSSINLLDVKNESDLISVNSDLNKRLGSIKSK